MRLAVVMRALAVTAAVLWAPLGGCRGERTDKPPRRFFPDMDHAPRWDPQEQTDFFADGRTARPTVAGTVAFGRTPVDPASAADRPWAASYMAERAVLLAEDERVFRGVEVLEDGSEVYVAYMPMDVTPAMLEHGQERFNIFCAACHGYEGDGQGMVGQRWAYPVTNIVEGVYTDREQRQGTDGWLWHVIREGVWDPATAANRMPAYKHALDEMDAWAVVSYLRALQRMRAAGVEDLSEAERDRLGAGGGAM